MKECVVILGCGYTGKRVAERLVRRGVRVIVTTRSGDSLGIEGVQTIRFEAMESLAPLSAVPDAARVVYSIPTLEPEPITTILDAIGERCSRFVYLSTTGVYGTQTEVNETTMPMPDSDTGRARLLAEEAVMTRTRSSLVLRPAAIYGPGRGVHVRMQRGNFQIGGDGSNYVSRIHVDDLATHLEAALFTEVAASWPVADDCPATSLEVAEFCARLLQVPMPSVVDPADLHPTRRANRRVDGSAIRRELGIELRFASYRTGIPASLEG